MTPLLSRLRWLPVLLLLSACAAPMLLIPGQRELMWALLTPLVGFDPNKVNLFEQPLIKQRMTSLLAEKHHRAPRAAEFHVHSPARVAGNEARRADLV